MQVNEGEIMAIGISTNLVSVYYQIGRQFIHKFQVQYTYIYTCTPMRGRFPLTTKAPTGVHSRCTGVHL